MIDGRPWLCKVGMTMADLMFVNLKFGRRPSSREGVKKRLLAGDDSDAKECLQPMFEICRNKSTKWHNWCMQNLQLRNL